MKPRRHKLRPVTRRERTSASFFFLATETSKMEELAATDESIRELLEVLGRQGIVLEEFCPETWQVKF